MEPLVEKAVAFARKAHEGQYRKGARRVPYVTHPLGVMAILRREGGVTDPVVLAAAALHDTVEDCGVTHEELTAEFGAEVAGVVIEVTNLPGEKGPLAKKAEEARAPTLSYRAKLVRLADKTYNVRELASNPPPWSPETKVAYVESAKRLVAAMGRVHEEMEANFAKAAEAALAAV